MALARSRQGRRRFPQARSSLVNNKCALNITVTINIIPAWTLLFHGGFLKRFDIGRNWNVNEACAVRPQMAAHRSRTLTHGVPINYELVPDRYDGLTTLLMVPPNVNCLGSYFDTPSVTPVEGCIRRCHHRRTSNVNVSRPNSKSHRTLDDRFAAASANMHQTIYLHRYWDIRTRSKKIPHYFLPGLMIAVFIHASLELRSDLLLFLFYLFRFLPLFFIIIYRRWICSQTLDWSRRSHYTITCWLQMVLTMIMQIAHALRPGTINYFIPTS